MKYYIIPMIAHIEDKRKEKAAKEKRIYQEKRHRLMIRYYEERLRLMMEKKRKKEASTEKRIIHTRQAWNI